MATFNQTVNPTPFGFFDTDATFQTEADSMVLFVKRKLGDDILSVELTKKQIWACFEEASLEYSRHINQMRTKSEIANLLGLPTGSLDVTNKYPRQTLEYILRRADPYASYANVGGSYNNTLGFIDLQAGIQDYDIYNDLKRASDSLPLFANLTMQTKLRIVEIFHVEPLAAQHFLLNASNITNFLATNFNYESYVNSTVFYVLPVFEDILRRGMLEEAFRVRRSQYSYDVVGTKLRIYPIPATDLQLGKLFIKVAEAQNPLTPSFNDASIDGVSGPHNIPFGNIPYQSITAAGRQWIRQYTLALCTELLGLVRSKFETVPIPNSDLRLNGGDLTTDGRNQKDKLITQLKEYLEELTHVKILEANAAASESLIKQLKLIPVPNGKSIIVG